MATFTVTATATGVTSNGIALTVKVITGASASQPGNTGGVNSATPSLAITPASTGSWVYGSNLGLAGTYTANGTTTYQSNATTSGPGDRLQPVAPPAAATTTAPTPVTPGRTPRANS